MADRKITIEREHIDLAIDIGKGTDMASRTAIPRELRTAIEELYQAMERQGIAREDTPKRLVFALKQARILDAILRVIRQSRRT